MAEANISVSQDQFSCSICLDLLNDPVTIPCGHSYCMKCITDCWNQDDQKRDYSCPQCRQTFTTRPALNKNVMFAEIVEKLRKTKLHKCQPDPSYAEAGDVECDVCVGRKCKAVKSCLLCVESYCQTHFEHHEKFHSGRRHKVTDATGRLKEMICSKHEKQLEIFCRTDQSCICYLCTMDEHRDHDTVAAVVERKEKQRSLEERQGNFQQSIKEKEKRIQELKEAVKSHKISAQTAMEDTERIFTELICSIERSRSEVIKMIRDQEKTEVSRAEEHLEELKNETEDLRRRNTELKQLSNTEDHTHFLQGFQLLSLPPESTDLPRINAGSQLLFDDVGKSVSELKETLESLCKREVKNIDIVTVSKGILQPPSPPDELTCPPKPFSLIPPSQPFNSSIFSSVFLSSAPPTFQPATPTFQPATPSFQSATPSFQSATPSFQSATPSFQSATPSFQSATPSFQSATPSFQSATPSFQSATPSFQSATPSFQSATPSFKPATPSFKPATPSFKPATPSFKPATPSFKPATPSFKPATSTFKPATPSFKPATLTFQPRAFSKMKK